MKVADLFEAPKGPDWKILYQVRNDDGSLNGGSFVVRDYVNKERAKAAAVEYLLKKYKSKEAKVIRVTQMPWEKVKVEEAVSVDEKLEKAFAHLKSEGYRWTKLKTGQYRVSNSSLNADERSDNGAREKADIVKDLKGLGVPGVKLIGQYVYFGRETAA